MSEQRSIPDILEDISRLVAEYAQARENTEEGRNVVVTGSVIVYEQLAFDEDDNVYKVNYMFPSALSMSSAMGLIHAGHVIIEDALLGDIED